jgi:hypothetical protein
MSIEGKYKKLNQFYAGRGTDTENTDDAALATCPNAMLIDGKLVQALDNRI